MIVIWSEPKRAFYNDEPLSYPENGIDVEKLALTALSIGGVRFWSHTKKHMELTYNYCHHFWDLRVFEAPGTKNPRDTIEQVRAYRTDMGSAFESQGDTWRLETCDDRKPICIPGERFWLRAEDPAEFLKAGKKA